MADSPQEARWYIAELTEEVAFEGSPRPDVIHRRTRLIFADSAEDAFEKALSLCAEHEPSYLNQNHPGALLRYWGLKEVNLEEKSDGESNAAERRRGFRKSDHLSPGELARLMSLVTIKPGALPN
jgi:hypothetical protein